MIVQIHTNGNNQRVSNIPTIDLAIQSSHQTMNPLFWLGLTTDDTSDPIHPTVKSISWLDEDRVDWASFLASTYIEALLISPLFVSETLNYVQYQPRGGEFEEDVQTYQSVQDGRESVDLHLARMDGNDVALVMRNLIEAEQEGWTSLLKGHLVHFVDRVVFSILQPFIEVRLDLI